MEGVQLVDSGMPVIGRETMRSNELQPWWGSVCILQAMLLPLSSRSAFAASALNSGMKDKKRNRHKLRIQKSLPPRIAFIPIGTAPSLRSKALVMG